MKLINKYQNKQFFIDPSYLLVVMITLAQLFEVSSQTCGVIPLPSDTTSIAAAAYSGCGSLTSLTVPSAVTFIGKGV